MSSYWDYLKDAYSSHLGTIAGPGWGLLQAGYNMLYDQSHGGDRYVLSKAPLFSWVRNLQDSFKQSEDRYKQTGVDEAYINRVAGFDGSALGGSNSAMGVSRMHGSLMMMYTPEVVEDVGIKFNNMYA